MLIRINDYCYDGGKITVRGCEYAHNSWQEKVINVNEITEIGPINHRDPIDGTVTTWVHHGLGTYPWRVDAESYKKILEHVK